MSGEPSLNYAFVVWIWCLYTTLLPLVAIFVAFVLRKRGLSVLKSSNLSEDLLFALKPATAQPATAEPAAAQPDSVSGRQRSLCKASGVANKTPSSWKIFHEEQIDQSDRNDSLAEIHYENHLKKRYPNNSSNENDITNEERTVNNIEFDQLNSRQSTNIHHDASRLLTADTSNSSKSSEMCSNFTNDRKGNSFINSADEIHETEFKIDPQNTVYHLENWQDVLGYKGHVDDDTNLSSDYASVTGIRHSKKICVPDNSILGETDIDMLSEADSIAMDKYLKPHKVLTTSINQLIFQTENGSASDSDKVLLSFEEVCEDVAIIYNGYDISLDGDDVLKNNEIKLGSSSELCENCTLLRNDCDISNVQPFVTNLKTNSDTRQKTVCDTSRNIYKTKSLPVKTTVTIPANIPRLLSLGEMIVLNNYTADDTKTLPPIADNDNREVSANKIPDEEKATAVTEYGNMTQPVHEDSLETQNKTKVKDCSIPNTSSHHMDATEEQKAMIVEDGKISISQSLHKATSEKQKTTVVEDEQGNMSLTEYLNVEIFSENGHPVYDKKTTYIYETETENISLIQITPATEPSIEPKILKINVLKDEDVNLTSETTISNTVLLNDEKLPENNNLEVMLNLLSMPMSELSLDQKISKLSNNMNESITLTEAPSRQTLPEKVKFDLKNKESVKVNEEEDNNLPVIAITSNLYCNEQENIELFDKVQCSNNGSENVLSKPKISIAYERNEFSMAQILLSGIDTTDKISTVDYDTESTATASKLRIPTEPAQTSPYMTTGSDLSLKTGNLLIPEEALENKIVIDKPSNISTTKTVPTYEILESKVESKGSVESTSKSDKSELKICGNYKNESTGIILPNKNILNEKEKSQKSDKSLPATAHQSVATILLENINKHDSDVTNVAMNASKNADRPTDQIMNLENLIKDTQRNLNQLINHLRKESEVNSKTSMKNVLETIPEEHKSVFEENSNIEKITSKDNIRISRDMIVYQTTTNTSAKRPEQLVKDTLLSFPTSTNKTEPEIRHSTSNISENVINADFVTVSHRLPVPSSNVAPILNLDRDQYAVLTDAKLEIVDIDASPTNSQILTCNSSSKSLSQECQHSDSNYEFVKIDKDKSRSDVDIGLVQTDSAVSEIQRTIESSLLNDLLYMGRSYSGTVDKGLMVIVPDCASEVVPDNDNNVNSKSKCGSKSGSNDTLFFITRESSKTTSDKTDNEENVSRTLGDCDVNTIHIEMSPNMQTLLEIKEDRNVKALEEKLIELHQRNESIRFNRHFEKIVSPNFDCDDNIIINGNSIDKKCRNRRDTNNSKKVLDILSKFTKKEIEDVLVKESAGILVAEDVDLTPKRLKTTTQQQAVIITKHESVNNITMPGTNTMTSFGTEVESDCFSESDSTPESISLPKKSSQGIRVRFEDDTYDVEDYSSRDNFAAVLTNPLRKNLCAETSYITDEYNKKGHVIPTYLKDVSDGIKALMTDLVKPMADVIPCGSAAAYDRELRQKSSTNSTEVQANLFTSSQIDLEPTNPYIIIPGKKLKPIIKPYVDRYYECPEFQSESSLMSQSPTSRSFDSNVKQSNINFSPSGVVQFDPGNPLNNVLLPPLNFHTHKYKPLTNDIEPCSKSSFKDFNTASDDKMSTQYDVLYVTPDYLPPTKGSSLNTKESYTTNTSQLLKIDESIEIINENMNDEGINTEIAMLDNKKLLENSSSLTLVNSMFDEVAYANKKLEKAAHDQWGTHNYSSPPSSDRNLRKFGKKCEVIYKQSANESPKNINEIKKNKKKKKNEPRTAKKCTSSVVDVTPNKIPKPTSVTSTTASKSSRSTFKSSKSVLSPIGSRIHDGDWRLSMSRRSDSDAKPPEKERKSTASLPNRDTSSKFKRRREPSPNVIIQQCGSSCDKDLTKANDEKSSDASRDGKFNVLMTSSWPSSENSSKDMGDSISSDMANDMGFPMDWQPELLNELSSKNLVMECESSADVIDSIDLLPFMGRRECAWESTSDNEWVFRLLHGRLRLIICFPHSDRSSRARADTPVSSVTVEATQLEMKNAVAELCIRFAMEAMRFFIGRECVRAGDVPSLLRRCAAVSRIALRWGRAMHDCWMHLVYNIDTDGYLTLNVANIPLRSVWDVTMNIDLVNNDVNEVPWPRASNVRVTPVVAGVEVTPQDVAVAIQSVSLDWGHAPRTLWRIVGYLQNLRKEPNLVSGVTATPATSQH